MVDYIEKILLKLEKMEEKSEHQQVLLHKIDKDQAVIKEQGKGINKRLDKLNGKTEKISVRVDKLEGWRDNLKGKIAIVVSVLTTAISLLIFFAKEFIGKYLR